MAALGQHALFVVAARGAVAVQHGAHLADHGLRRVGVRARPAGHGADLPEETQVDR